MPESTPDRPDPQTKSTLKDQLSVGYGEFSKTAKKWNPLHKENYIRASQLVAAVMVGIFAYLYTKLIAVAQAFFMHSYGGHPYLTSIAAPFLFVAATWLVIRFAPEAKGSGIPQVI
ncbi:MAG: hypothetical protein ACREL1_05065, partial [bacterium]